MKKFVLVFLFCLSVIAPAKAGVAGSIKGLHSVLDTIFDEMLPLASSLINVCRFLAGFAALFYISHRVWKHIARSEPIDFYPLLRPFVIGLCILMFQDVLSLLNGILQPITDATRGMVENENKTIESLLNAKQTKSEEWQNFVGESGSGNKERWAKYLLEKSKKRPGATPKDYDKSGSSWFSDIRFAMEKAMYNFKQAIKRIIHDVLEIFFEAASLLINTLRTFFLIVMAIIGPLAFGFAVFDGFQNTLTDWLSKYINYYLWLPVANILGAILGKIQSNMLKMSVNQADDSFFSSTDIGFLVFMIIGIGAFFAIPSVSNLIVATAGGGGGGGGGLTGVANTIGSAAGGAAGGMMGAAAGSTVGAGKQVMKAGAALPGQFVGGYKGSSSGSFGASMGRAAKTLVDKLKG